MQEYDERNLKKEWQQIVIDSKKLKELATTGHWSNFLSLSETRSKHMETFFHHVYQTDDVIDEDLKNDITDILAYDGEIREILSDKNSVIAQQMMDLQQKQQAVRTYANQYMS